MDMERINIQLNNIEVAEFSFYARNIGATKDSRFGFNITIEHKVHKEAEQVEAVCHFNIYNGKNDSVVAKVDIACIYHTEEIENFIDKQNRLSFPNEIVEFINSTSLSTCRGVLFSIFRGTSLHPLILPIIDPKNMKVASK